MKHKILSIFAAVAAVLGAAACNELLEQNQPVEISMSLAVQPDSLEVKAEGDAVSFTFDAPDYWFASCPADWVTIDPASGKPGEATITVKANQNTGLAREALVSVTVKTQRGQFKIKQEAWPYTSQWAVSGTVNGGTAVNMEDQGDGLVWKVAKLPVHAGEAFKLKMGSSTTLGLDGALALADGVQKGAVKIGGADIVLPESGYWDVTLDLNSWTVAAELVDRFDWAMVGTISGGDWTQDFAMNADEAKLVWTANNIPYNLGEEFKFRMDKLDAFILGLDGSLAATDAENTYKGNLKAAGASIVLPDEGYWNITLNLQDNTVTAVFVEGFPQVHEGLYWENDDPEGHGGVSWNGVYRFGLKGNDGNNECINTFPEEVWTKIKTKPFYLVFTHADWYQVQVTNGWWDANWKIIKPGDGDEIVKDLGDGTFAMKIDLTDNPDFVASLDQKHLLFTGEGYTPLGLYPEFTWENDDPEGHGVVTWSSVYRFGLEGKDGNNECITTFPESIWNKLKTSVFYMTFTHADWYQVQVTNGWWDVNWKIVKPGDGDDLVEDNGDGTYTLTVDFSDSADYVSSLDQKHLLFTGEGYTPLKIQLIR